MTEQDLKPKKKEEVEETLEADCIVVKFSVFQ